MNLTHIEKQQIKRIKKYSKEVFLFDSDYGQLGAKHHKYIWDKPISEKVIQTFELNKKIKLPRSYRIYLKYLSNGGPCYGHGLYPMERGIAFGNLNYESKLAPFMEPTQFNNLLNESQRQSNKFFLNGLLTIGFIDSSNDISIVIKGKYRGRLIITRPRPTAPFNFINDFIFLDWYERWLIGIIKGYDMKHFLESFPGTQSKLINLISNTNNTKIVLSLLQSLARFPTFDDDTLPLCKTMLLTTKDFDVKLKILNILSVDHPHIVKQYINDFLNSDNIDDIILGVKGLNILESENINIDFFLQRIIEVMDRLPGTAFYECCLLLETTPLDRFDTFYKFFDHIDAEIRRFAVIAACDTVDYKNHLNKFKLVLKDSSPIVILAAIQSVGGTLDPRFLSYYKRAWDLYPDSKLFIRSSIKKVLKDMKLSEDDLK